MHTLSWPCGISKIRSRVGISSVVYTLFYFHVIEPNPCLPKFLCLATTAFIKKYNVEQTTTLATRIQEKKRELLHLLGQAEHPNCAMDLENKKLLHVLRQAPGPLPG
jgi:hypothetical protein